MIVQKCIPQKLCKINSDYHVKVVGNIKSPRTWLESVEADMAELGIDKEDVHE